MPSHSQDSPLHTIESLSAHLHLTHRQSRTLLRDYQVYRQPLTVKRGAGMVVTSDQLQELELFAQLYLSGFTVQQLIRLRELDLPELWQFLERPLRIHHLPATEMNALQLILDIRRDTQRAAQLLEGTMRPLAQVMTKLNEGVILPAGLASPARPAPAPVQPSHSISDPLES